MAEMVLARSAGGLMGFFLAGKKQVAENKRSSADRIRSKEVIKLYGSCGLGVKLYNWIRWFLVSNFEEIEPYVPAKGKIVDLACGYGVFTILTALRSNKRYVTGVDLIKERINSGQKIIETNKDLKNIEFQVDDIRDADIKNSDGIILMDVLCYFPFAEQKDLLSRCFNNLNKSGVLVIKTFNKRPFWKYLLFYLQEVIVITAKVLKGSNFWKMVFRGRIFVKDSGRMEKILGEIGFKVITVSLDKMRYQPHIAYICHKQS